jgi:hypothetical protein
MKKGRDRKLFLTVAHGFRRWFPVLLTGIWLQINVASALAIPRVIVESVAADSLLAREIQAVSEAFLSVYGSHMPGEAGDGPVRIIIASGRDDFSRLAGGRDPEWAAGLVIERGRTILLMNQLLADRGQMNRLLRHELAHVMLDRRLRGTWVPRWFHEGYAQVQAAEWDMEVMWVLARAAWTGTAIPLSELRRSFPVSGPRARLAYAESQAAVRDLTADPNKWRHMMDLLGRGEPFSLAMAVAGGRDLVQFEARFDGELMPGFRRWGLLLSTPFVVGVMVVLFVMAAWRRRRKMRVDSSGRFGPENEWLLRGWIDRGR